MIDDSKRERGRKWFVRIDLSTWATHCPNQSLVLLTNWINTLELRSLLSETWEKGSKSMKKTTSKVQRLLIKRHHVLWFASKRYRSVAAAFCRWRCGISFSSHLVLYGRRRRRRQRAKRHLEPIHLLVVGIINQAHEIFSSWSFQSASWFKCFGFISLPVFVPKPHSSRASCCSSPSIHSLKSFV